MAEAEERLTDLEKTAKNRRYEDGSPPSLLEKMGLSVNVRRWIRHLLAEFLAVIIFIYIGGMSLLSGNIVAIALAHGLTIALLVIAIGHISGAHLNPAVTIGIMINQKISILEGVAYIVTQLVGSLFGGLLIYGSLSTWAYNTINGGALFIPFPGNPVFEDEGLKAQGTEFGLFLVEVILTANLVYFVLMGAVDRGDNVLAALGVGCCVVAGILACGSVSGASMNPARTFGPLSVYSGLGGDDKFNIAKRSGACAGADKCTRFVLIWKYAWVQLIGPVVGAVIAGGVYRVFYAYRNREDD